MAAKVTVAKARLRTTKRDVGTPRRGFAHGFTLIEIAVVLFIIGLVMTLAMPYLGTIQSARLRGQARQLATRATYLYEAAAAQKVILRLNLNLDNNSYYVTRLDPFAAKPAYVAETGPDGERVILPPDVRIRDVSVEGLGSFKRGIASCQFYPAGFADGTVIHMIDDRGDVYTLTINPLTGQVAAMKGDYNPMRAARNAR
ncbi:MAG: pilus assembly FimT family protein [Candidatus Binataceae bacterium]